MVPKNMTNKETNAKARRHYTTAQKSKALQAYGELKSVTKAIRRLGYPTRQTMYYWIAERERIENAPLRKEKTKKKPNKKCSFSAFKRNVLRRCFEQGESVTDVAREVGISRVSIYAWRRKYMGTDAKKEP